MNDAMIASLKKEFEVDSFTLKMMEHSFARIMQDKSETEIHINLHQDTIWRYTVEEGRIKGDLLRIDREQGILYYHAKIDKSVMYKEYHLF